MANRAFLRPRSVDDPPQGDYEYKPRIIGFEDVTLAGLLAKILASTEFQALSLDVFWVVEEIEYEVVVTKLAVGGLPAELNYSCLVWYTEALKI